MPVVYEKKKDGFLSRIFRFDTMTEARDHIKWLKSEDRNKGRTFIVRKNAGAGMATRRKNAGIKKIRRQGKGTYNNIQYDYKLRSQNKRRRLRKLQGLSRFGGGRRTNPGFNLHSLLKWGIIAGVGYFLFTKFVKPNLSPALSGIVNDPTMSWSYIDPSRMLQAQIGNPMGQMVRNRPITVGRGVM